MPTDSDKLQSMVCGILLPDVLAWNLQGLIRITVTQPILGWRGFFLHFAQFLKEGVNMRVIQDK